jgi:hypothetical protein
MPSSLFDAIVLGTIINLISDSIILIVVFVAGRYLQTLTTANPGRRRLAVLLAGGLVSAPAAAGVWILSVQGAGVFWSWTLVVLGASGVVYILLRELQRFWRVGVFGADQQIRRGLDYDAALRLVRTDLSFLGTGAYKLSRSSEFAPALRRCRQESTVRFLLRSPDDTTLATAARRAGKPDDEYRRNVTESLRHLARLQISIGNIEVRFYEEDPIFRVMIIDRRIVLLSYNVYGRGDGSELPQLHLVDVSANHPLATSFVHAYERYFEERWSTARPWTPEEFA